ncbi:hypothetical protein ABPG75_013498 [Micractinium tetrahymenae]
MSGAEKQQGMPPKPPPASEAEVLATEAAASARAAANKTFAGSLTKLAVGVGGLWLAWYMWKKSEEPMPQPMSEAVSKAVSVGGGALEQVVEESRGTYPGAASDVQRTASKEAAKGGRG